MFTEPDGALADIRASIFKLCEQFDDKYWMARDEDGEYPFAFHRAIADGGWLGIAMPEAYGGSGLGITEAAVMMQAVAESGAGMSGASAIHMNIFGLHPVVLFGTDEQKKRMLPPLLQGKDKSCFAVTEPNVGLNTLQLKTFAKREGDHYSVSGQKIWISAAQDANKVLILTRTTPLEEVKDKTKGLTLFYTDIDRSRMEIREIHKMGRHAVDSNMIFIDSLKVPVADRIGEEGNGFRSILQGMNPERILLASEAVGIGRIAIRKAAKYAKERIVFGRPIGQNQGIQHPLARCWAELEAANLMVFRAAKLYDSGAECGAEANAAKYLAAEAAFTACETSLLAHGGMGYSREFQIERLMREAFIPRIAPVSREMILSFIAERVLGLPKSY